MGGVGSTVNTESNGGLEGSSTDVGNNGEHGTPVENEQSGN